MGINQMGGILQMNISYGVPSKKPALNQRTTQTDPIRITAAAQTGTRNRIMQIVPPLTALKEGYLLL
jgi:hypothetical protein